MEGYFFINRIFIQRDLVNLLMNITTILKIKNNLNTNKENRPQHSKVNVKVIYDYK